MWKESVYFTYITLNLKPVEAGREGGRKEKQIQELDRWGDQCMMFVTDKGSFNLKRINLSDSFLS